MANKRQTAKRADKQADRAERAARAAAAIRERERRERRRRLLSIGGVAAALVVVIAVVAVLYSRSDDTSANVAAAPPPGSPHGLTIGPSSAAHKVVIYEDFLCPFCGELEKQTHEKLEALADAGTVQVEYRPIELLGGEHDYSGQATEAFAATLTESGAEAAQKMHDLLFADQPDESGPFPSQGDLAALMTKAGADTETVAAFKAGDGATWAEEASDAADDLSVKSTPTIILDGKLFQDGRTIDQIAANLLKAVQ